MRIFTEQTRKAVLVVPTDTVDPTTFPERISLYDEDGNPWVFPTGADVTTEINAAIEALVDGAPETLNTLKELADQLGTDVASLLTQINDLEALFDLEQDARIAADQGLDVRITALENADIRVNHVKSTASIATDASEDWTITEDGIIALRVAFNQAARVRVYASAAYRTADAARPIGEYPEGDHGLLLEVISDGTDLDYWLGRPAIMSSADGGDNLYATVTNLGAAGVVQVTITYIKLET